MKLKTKTDMLRRNVPVMKSISLGADGESGESIKGGDVIIGTGKDKSAITENGIR